MAMIKPKYLLPALLLLIAIATGIIIQHRATSGFKSLPSPIYGGDYYHQMGCIIHIREGGNPLLSSTLPEGSPGYLPLYSFLCASFSDLCNLKTIKGMFTFSLFLYAVATILWFCFFSAVFENNWISLAGTALANGLNAYPILKYTPFTHQVMLPLFLLCLYLTITHKKTRYYISLAIIYGLLTLSHIVAFVGATLILLTFLLFELYENKHQIPAYISSNIKNWVLFLCISIPVVMLYWYKPIFVHHLKSTYDRIHMDTPDFARLDVQITFLFDTIKSYFFNFNDIFTSLKTIFLWIGLYSLFSGKSGQYKAPTSENRFILQLLTGSFIATFCYFITEPVLKMNFIPTYMQRFYISTITIILMLKGLKFIYQSINLNVRMAALISSLLFIALYLNSVFAFQHYIQHDQWVKNAKNPVHEIYQSLQKYLFTHTDVNDVILSTKELSFAVNAVSGRKAMVNRWAQQNNPYADIPQRDLDAAKILYGNDINEKLNLIRKYNISYLYWDYFWIRSEFNINSKLQITGIFDPLLTLDRDYYRKQLDRAGVKYLAMNFWLDPACRQENIRKFNLLIVAPQNYASFTMPWKPDLNKYLHEVWAYKKQGQKLAVLYKIELD
jgi:hypothetical protein